MKKSIYMPVLVTLGALAVINRIPAAREALTGENGDSGWWPF